ncbi:MAG: dipeptidase [Bacteroidetes bacterium]|nr:dipeptidase [Bacteroidota bacterium]MBS1539077.1 dipeptidase [Bacteroidota bacterium]
MKKILYGTGAMIAIAIILFFAMVPTYVDKAQNKVVHTGSFAKNTWYDAIPFIADLHCDELLWNRNFLKQLDYGHVDLPRMQQANMALQVFTIVSKVPKGINIEQNDSNTDQITLLSFAQLRPPSAWFSLKARSLNQCANLHSFAKNSAGQFRVIASKADLNKFIADRKTNHKLVAGMLGLEGAQPLEGNLNNLDEFFKIGVRYIGLTHFYDNEWGGSAHGMKKGGLTPIGKRLIQKMDSLHIIIDLAHNSQQTIQDILALHTGPVLVSHTGVKGICDNQRNLSDEQIVEIGKRNGLIGIGLWETAVCGSDATATARSIRYVADKIGADKVALGSDWDGAITAHFDVTGLPLIVQALEKEKFSRDEIEKIMGGNVRDFFLRNLPD